MKLHMNIIRLEDTLTLCFLQSAAVSPPNWRSWTNVWQHIQGEILNFVGVIFMPCENNVGGHAQMFFTYCYDGKK